ncbi:MAG: GAF domain-containing protein [Actinobacteria bacterium]|nr:GAF domain-containing protein [Actinomycetota bacterium]
MSIDNPCTPETSQTARLRGLIDAGIALGSEVSLDALLQKLVETAAALTGARYAALGVIDETGTELERFLTTGIGEELHAAIGELPRGRGILGVLIKDAEPLLLESITDDPRSVGFPPHHPAMRGFLGVPILLRGRAYGNLYLTEKAGGPFTAEDQGLVETLAAQAAVAIENARLLQDATTWSAQLEALNEVGAALAGEVELPRLLQLICRRLRGLIGARVVTIALPASERTLRIEAADGAGADEILGLRLERAGSKSGDVLERRRAERVDALADDPEVDQHATSLIDARTGLYVPLLVGARPIGVIVAHDKEGEAPRFSDDDLRLAEIFASRAAVAVDLSERVARDALRRVVEAQELERRRLARELHDQTGQELTSVLLGLKAVEEAKSDAERAKALAAVREQVVETLHDVRRLAVELRPKALDDFGLAAALERLRDIFSEQTGMRVDLESRIRDRLPPDVETALYRIVQEALTNIVKHAQANAVSIVLARKAGAVTALIEDDGRGFNHDGSGEGLGLLGMGERLALLGGRLKVESRPGAGTTIVAEVPLS